MRFWIAVGMVVSLISFAVGSNAGELDKVISVKGEVRQVIKPDIAHCFLRINGYGTTYNISQQKADDGINSLHAILKETFGFIPEISILKKEHAPKSKFAEGDFFEEQQKEFFTGMAKAMKGDVSAPSKDQTKKELMTSVLLYFSIINYEEANISRMRNSLSENGLAFDKQSLFDFSSDFDGSKSAIYYGLQKPNILLGRMANEAYKVALEKADVITKSINKKIGDLTKISGCGEDIEGTVSISDKASLMKSNLGPLGTDPNRLVVKFKKEFVFAIE